MNYYERHIGDYLKDTAHLSLLEHGIYTRLLDVYYTRECGIDAADVARLIGARSKDERAALQVVLSEFFILETGIYVQSRCDREIARFQDKQRKAKASAETRWAHTERNANAMRTHSEGNALQTPVTSNQSPIEDSVAKATAGKPALSADEIIFGYGLPMLVNAGATDKHARSFLGGLRKAHGDDSLVDRLRDCIRAKPLQPMEWLAAAMLPDATGSPSETKYQRAKREQMEKDFPNLTNRPKEKNVAIALG